jgi:hypothetical protein
MSRLVLLPVDPFLIYAYWELSPLEQEVEAQAVLRFYKPSKVPEEWFDIEIDVQSPSWYVHLWSAEESYYADLGLKHSDGTLIRLARSSIVLMPRAHPAIVREESFMRVEPEERRAELIPPPVPHHQPQEATFDVAEELKELNIWLPPPKPTDSEETVRETLKRAYTHVERPERPEPAAAISSSPPGRTPVDLTEAAERKLDMGLSSAALQGNRRESK